MLCRLINKECSRTSQLVVGIIGWFVLISGLHYWLNIYEDERKKVLMGYMPVITNLAAPLLDHASREGGGTRFESLKFASFAEMAEALRNDQIQAAFIIAPLSIVLRQQGTGIKVVYIGNRHESTLVAHKDLRAKSLNDLVGKTVAIPMRYSGHNISLLQEMDKLGLSGEINIVEMNPPDMAAALATKRLDAYFVGEPFAANTLKNGQSSLVFHVEEVWEDFICNLVIVKESLIDKDPEVVETLVHSAARSGAWAEKNIDQAAEIASNYWNQSTDMIRYAMTTPGKRIVFDNYLPKEEELQKLADLMVRYGLTDNNDISGLVEDRFARGVSFNNISDINSVLDLP